MRFSLLRAHNEHQQASFVLLFCPTAVIMPNEASVTKNHSEDLAFVHVASHDHENVALCQELRQQVFVKEQGIPLEVELDGHDHSPLAHHILVKTSRDTIGTGRIVFSKSNNESSSSSWTVSLGRIAVIKNFRKQGLGKQIVKKLEALALAQTTKVVERLVLTPHSYLEAFYTGLGFWIVPGGEKIVNENCRLITMEKRFSIPPDTNSPRQSERRKRICLFGTSANPPTGAGGHLGIVQALLDLKKSQPTDIDADSELRFDEVHVLPVYRHTFVPKRHQLGQVSFHHRLAMCERAFCPLSPRVVVSRAEERSFQRMTEGTTDEEELATLRVGTVDLLDMLQEEHKGTEFSFCLGADTFMDLTGWTKWKRSKDVLRLLGGRLVVVHRKGLSFENELRDRVQHVNYNEDGHVIFLDVPELEVVSSTMAREAKNKETLRQLVPDNVADYIVSHKLYGFNGSS
jgi:nicotinate (nicotinamide) nucleotide adenylyltransferase